MAIDTSNTDYSIFKEVEVRSNPKYSFLRHFCIYMINISKETKRISEDRTSKENFYSETSFNDKTLHISSDSGSNLFISIIDDLTNDVEKFIQFEEGFRPAKRDGDWSNTEFYSQIKYYSDKKNSQSVLNELKKEHYQWDEEYNEMTPEIFNQFFEAECLPIIVNNINLQRVIELKKVQSTLERFKDLSVKIPFRGNVGENRFNTSVKTVTLHFFNEDDKNKEYYQLLSASGEFGENIVLTDGALYELYIDNDNNIDSINIQQTVAELIKSKSKISNFYFLLEIAKKDEFNTISDILKRHDINKGNSFQIDEHGKLILHDFENNDFVEIFLNDDLKNTIIELVNFDEKNSSINVQEALKSYDIKNPISKKNTNYIK